MTEPTNEIDSLREENESLKRRLELRAVENRALVVALDTIGMCAHAQGRRLTVAILAVADAGLNLACESIVVCDAAGDEPALARAIAELLGDRVNKLRESRAMHPAAENLLAALADLDEDGVLEDTYNVDPESDHHDVRSDDVPPLESALYQWRALGYPISNLDDQPDPLVGELPDDEPGKVVRFPPRAEPGSTS